MALKCALWFDTSDFINPESEEALAYVLDMLDDLGIRASFKMVGEKVRNLKEHGREDLLTRLARHDLGYHTDVHSFHPTMTQYCEPLAFNAGVAEFERREKKGIEDTREILGKRLVGYGQPGCSWTPDVCPVLKKYGIDVYLDDHFILDVSGQPFSYGGMLNCNTLHRIMRCWPDHENPVEEALAEFDRLAAEEHSLGDVPEETKLFSIFYHPCEFINRDHFWDLDNCPDGKNLCYDEEGNFTGYIKTPLTTFERMRERIDTVREFLQAIMERGVTFVTMEELPEMVCRRNREITREDVKGIAETILSTATVNFVEIDGEFVSPVEIFGLLRQALCGCPLKPVFAYGPQTRCCPSLTSPVHRTDVMAAMELFDTVLGYPQLLSAYAVGENTLSAGELCYAAAYFLLHKDAQECEVKAVTCATEQYVMGSGDWSGYWLFPPHFPVPNTYEKTRLQCWTLKPVRLV